MNRKTAVLVLLTLAVAVAAPKVQLPVEQTGSMTIDLVQGYSFDPLASGPNLPEDLTVAQYDGAYGYYIVQFPGPVRPEWKAAVGAEGADLLWYLPNYSFIARVRNDRAAAIAALPEVRWLGAYQPAYKLLTGLLDHTGPQDLIVVFHKAENAYELLNTLGALGARAMVPEFNEWNNSVRLTVDASRITDIVRLPGVFWVEPFYPVTPDNKDAQWVDMHGYSPSDTSRTVWNKGVDGSSVYVSLTDQRLWHGHDLFRDPANSTPGPLHRKVYHYFGTIGAESHGTHTSGTLCGDDEPVGGTSLHDGLAKKSRLYFQYYSSFPTGWDMNVWFAGPESGAAGLRAFNHSMSLSRKDTYNIYVFSDMTADQFVWNHPKFLHCNSMGNFGTNQMGHPVMSKNIISTGGTMPGTSCRTFYTTSSRGPTSDGRRKPQLISPASGVYSASHTNASGYVSMSGTSMATPNMTGSMALLRDYFRKGYYPTGDTTTGTPMEISAAMNKAVGIVGASNDISGYTVPDNNVGWGRVCIDSSLYFAGEQSKLWVNDDELGLQTGDSAVFTIDVASDSQPFRVALCWSDYPGVMQAQRIIVNDLNLLVVSPSGTEYKGNVWTGGQSTTGGVYDSLNVEECFRLNTPQIGQWTVKVYARNIPQGPQPFALAAIGMFQTAPPPAHDVGVLSILAPVDSVPVNDTVTPMAVVRNYTSNAETFPVWFHVDNGYTDSVTVMLGGNVIDTVDFSDWSSNVVGSYRARCSTALSTDENPANNEAFSSFRTASPTDSQPD
ncbi:MAG: S8 family serine peptidase [bacterium]